MIVLLALAVLEEVIIHCDAATEKYALYHGSVVGTETHNALITKVTASALVTKSAGLNFPPDIIPCQHNFLT